MKKKTFNRQQVNFLWNLKKILSKHQTGSGNIFFKKKHISFLKYSQTKFIIFREKSSISVFWPPTIDGKFNKSLNIKTNIYQFDTDFQLEILASKEHFEMQFGLYW